jgi:ankyrin repeat protein
MNYARLTVVILLFLLSYTNITAQDKNTKLILAAENGDEKQVIKSLLDTTDINFQDINGYTSLIFASQNGFPDIVKILIYNNADINTKGYDSTTALIQASKYEHKDIAELLILKGADINAANDKKITSLIYAASYGYYALTEMLIKYGANLDIKTKDGTNAIISSTISNNLNIVEMLIDKGADINSSNNAGLTPLSIAAINGYKDIAELLIKKGADINYEPNKAKSPVNLAKIYGNNDIVKLLREKGAKVNIAPHFNKLSAGIDFNFNINDNICGGNIGIQEAKYNTGLYAGFNTRVWAKRILKEQQNNIYYQLWERRSMFFINIEKKFILNTSYKSKQGIFLCAKEIYTYGNYYGSNEKVKKEFKTIPQLGLFWMNNDIALKINYEYIDFNTYKVSPHRINLSFMFFINIDKYRKYYTQNYWL